MRQTLTLEQCKDLLRAIETHAGAGMKERDTALITSLLLCGSESRLWTWEDALSNVVTLPFAVYHSLRTLATSKRLALFPSDAHFGAHWLNGVPLRRPIFRADERATTQTGKALSTQEITRRLKRFGRKAGISWSLLNLRTLNNTHQTYLEVYGGADAFSEALGLLRVQPAPARSVFPRAHQVQQDDRLHGLFRRSGSGMSPR